MVEQWTHKPLVVGSNPTLATQPKTAQPAVFWFNRPVTAADAGNCVYNRAMSDSTGSAANHSQRLKEIILLFLRLGATAFGGPAAHVAMMRDMVVTRRKWVTEQQFLDLLGATNLIPGPNSTEMSIHLGYLRAGFPGLVAAGVSFILPAMLVVIGMAWAYVRYGSTPQAAWLLYGIKPVVIAIILHALWKLGRQAVRGPWLAALGCGVLALYLLGVNELLLLFAAGLLFMLLRNLARLRSGGARMLPWFLPGLGAREMLSNAPLETSGSLVSSVPLASSVLLTQAPFSLAVLFLTFLKIGSVLYGSGYVLLAFLQSDFVERLGWLTQAQLLDAVAVGQVTPGPLFTTATFIGYLLGGVPGALLATLGIFLPSFIFVALTNPIIPRMRSSPWASALLDGVNVAALGLMAGVTLELAQSSLVDPLTILLALVSALLLFRFQVNSTWLVLGGGLVGLLLSLLGLAG